MTRPHAATITALFVVVLVAGAYVFTAYALHRSNKGDRELIMANCHRVAAIRKFQDAYQKQLAATDPEHAAIREPLLATLRADFAAIGGCP